MAEESENSTTIDRPFFVDNMVVIKQEPQETILESINTDNQVAASTTTTTANTAAAVAAAATVDDTEVDINAEINFADLTFTEVSDVVLQRAVSPPSFLSPNFSENKTENAMSLYKEKFNLKEVQVELERCDKIWETLQLIKNVQDFIDMKKEPSESLDKSPYQQLLGVSNNVIPDFRFSVKSKKKLYYCVTCGKEFIDNQHLRQHGINAHKICMNPKRIYRPRTDAHIKTANDVSDDDNDTVEEQMSNNVSELTNSQQSERKQFTEQTESNENEKNKSSKSDKHTIMTSYVKKKMKCILCKRITADIVNHIKGYHKVGCYSTIIAQCEKITSDITYGNVETDKQTNKEDVSSTSDNIGSSAVALKRRKKITTNWTIKKKYKETPKNFDLSKNRVLNTPLYNTVKPDNVVEGSVHGNTSDQRLIEKTQSLKTSNEINSQYDRMNINEESEDSNAEQTSCECGRSFRNYHTLYLHKIKCKGLNEHKITDTDSGVGISIKIKKNKNDSYEVVPQSILTDGIYKVSRNFKDSDVSSNDSGMVSVDYNNQRPDSSELLSNYGKNHSILRIQVADDDEEVDVTDGEDLNEENLNENGETNNKLIKSDQRNDLKELKNCYLNKFNSLKDHHIVPSLSNLCNQVLMKENQLKDISTIDNLCQRKSKRKINCPCGKNFKSPKYLNIHVRRYHPSLLKCNYCITNFDRIEKYFEHKCKVTEGKSFIEPIIQTQCIECKSLVDLGEQFDKHMRIHNLDSTTFACFKCDLKFDNQHQRKNHFDIEHGYSLCRICNKLLHIDYVLQHEAYHDGLGYPCHICKKAYDQNTLLKEHIKKVHDPIVNEDVKCFVCSKKIKLRLFKKHLSFHMHSEICKKCNKCMPCSDEEKVKNHKESLEWSSNSAALNATDCDV